jgi:tetratricopeptide (TPR) repeat protein
VGTRFGRFEVLEELGRGSFGVVFRCRDTELDRVVAVKVPRPGTLGSPEEEDRFLREARSAARLAHPNIVALHETGRIEGVPYLVSAYVAGTTLAEWAAARKPCPLRAAAVVAALANALHHAHGHGVIHRDLKPSNVLIDAEGAPQVTDFGLARAQQDSGRLTHDGEVLGTPAYMPPEQARGEAHRVDARGDVYSLGVILYELLTGTLPFHGAGWLMLLQVREAEPAPPRRLNGAVPRDLETVCLKAMAKELLRRYGTAAELAADLGRFLRGEPVKARPVGPIAALLGRCRRKPLATATVAAQVLLLAVACTLLGGSWQRTWRFQSEAATRLAEAGRLRAQRLEMVDSAYQTAMRLAQLARSQSPSGLEGAMGRTDAADAVLRDLQGFLAQLRTDAAFRPRLGAALMEYASVAGGLGRRHEAAAAWQEAMGIYADRLRRDPDNAELHTRSGECHKGLCDLDRRAGRFDEADRHGRLAAACWRRSIALCEAALRLHPDQIAVRKALALNQLHLGFLLSRDGPSPDGLRFLLAARDELSGVCRAERGDVSTRETLGICLETLADWYQAAGRWADARPVLDQAKSLWEGLLRINPGVDQHRERLAECLANLAMVHRAEGHLEDALAACERALPTWEDLLRRDPSNVLVHWGLARSLFWRGAALYSLGRVADALACYESAADHFARPSPAETAKLGSLGASYHMIGRLRNDLGLPESALSAFREALKVREVVCQRADNGPGDHSACAGTWQRLGETLERLGRDFDAAAAYRQAIVHQTAACEREPSSQRYARDLDDHRAHLAHLQDRLAINSGGAGAPQ